MKKGGDTRDKAAANGKRVGRPPKIAPADAQAVVIAQVQAHIDGRSNAGRTRAGSLIEALNTLPPKNGDSIEVAGWRRFWDSTNQAVALEVRKWLYDKADGKAVQTVNHVHDKPTGATDSKPLSDRFRIAMQKGEERVRSRPDPIN